MMREMALTAEHLVVIGRGRLIAKRTHRRVRWAKLRPRRHGPVPASVDLAGLLAASGAAPTGGGLAITGLDVGQIGDLAAAHGKDPAGDGRAEVADQHAATTDRTLQPRTQRGTGG